MDAVQLQKCSFLLVAAGLLAATPGRAGNLLVSSTSVVLTGRVTSQAVQVTSSDTTAVPFTVTVTETDVPSIPWVTATADKGTTPDTVTIFLRNDLASQGSGPFNAKVQLTPTSGGGSGATISVQFQPGPSGPSAGLTVTPGPTNPNYALTLAYNTNSNLPQQTVSVNNLNSYNASITYDTSNSLQLTTAGQVGTILSSVPGTQVMSIQLAQAAASLPTGSYFATVVISGAGGQATISVTINVNGGAPGGGVIVNPSTLAFSYQNGGPTISIPSQSVLISAPAGAFFSASYTSDAGWLALGAPLQGEVPGSLQAYVVIPQGGLKAGTYTGSISITVTSSTGTYTQLVSVNLFVSDSPVLWPTVAGTSSGTVIFNSPNGVATPASQTVNLLASDRSVVTGLALVSVPNFANVNLTGSTVTITPNSGLTGAVYAGNVVVSSNLANGQVAIPVILLGSTSGATGPLTLDHSAFTFQALVGGAAPTPQSLNVNSGSQVGFNATVSSNAPWLSISPSGNLLTNQVLTLSVNPALAGNTPGTLNGSVFLVSNGVTQTVPVYLQLSGNAGSGNVTTDQSSLSFTATAGGAAPGARTLLVSNAVSGTPGIFYNVSSSASWLNVTPSQGTTQSTVTVTVNPANLTAGSYTGRVTISPTGGTPLDVPVYLTLQPAATISASPGALTFTFRAGGDAPGSQIVTTSGGPFTTQAASDTGWLSASPATGNTGDSITVSANVAGVSAGTHSGTLIVTGAQGVAGSVFINVTLNVTPPLPTVSSVVNGASFLDSGSISPGEFITLLGTFLGPTSPLTAQVDASGNVATQLGGVRVRVNGFLAPLVYVSANQVSAVVPYEIIRFLGTKVSVVLDYLGQTSNGISKLVVATNPGIFTQNSSGSGPGAFNANFTLNGANNPVAKGGAVTFFLTGEGQLTPAGVTGMVNPLVGSAPGPVAGISVSIDGRPATYSYAAGVPGAVEGVLQLNVNIPPDARSGELPVVVSIGGVPSQPGVTVWVR